MGKDARVARTEVLANVGMALLEGLPLPDRLAAVERAFLESANKHDDVGALQLIQTLGLLYIPEPIEHSLFRFEATHRFDDSRRKACEACFVDRIMWLWGQIPDHRLGEEYYSEVYPRGWSRPKIGTLTKTKEWMIGQIANQWEANVNEKSVLLFDFLLHIGFGGRGRHTNYAIKIFLPKGADRLRFKPETDAVLQAIRTRTDGRHNFSVEKLEEWLELPGVPEEVQYVLAVNRTRNGGAELARKDVRRAKALFHLDV